MKKTLLVISVLAVLLLSGCLPSHVSKEQCFYCGTTPAYDYEIDGNRVTFCKECYEKEMEQNSIVKQELNNNIN